MVTYFNELLACAGLKRQVHQQADKLESAPHAGLETLAKPQLLPVQLVWVYLRKMTIVQQYAHLEHWKCWQSFLWRQQEVAALARPDCSGYQISSQRGLVEEIVKTCLCNVLVKCNLHGKWGLQATRSDKDLLRWGI